MKSIKIFFDGDEEDAIERTCGPNGGCDLNHTYNLEAAGLSGGEHTVTVQATDHFGHAPTEKDITFTAPGTAPSDEDNTVVDMVTTDPATPAPMTPSGPAAAGTFTRTLWEAEETNTMNGVQVVTSNAATDTALTGTVIDSAQSTPVAAATVTMTTGSTTATTSTDSQGSFAFAGMPPGTYTMTITAPSLGTYTMTNSQLVANESYYRQAELTTAPQTIDDAPRPPREQSALLQRFKAGGGTIYGSNARIPPYIRVAMVPLVESGMNQCAPAGDRNSAPIKRYAWSYYVNSVVIEETKILQYNEKSFKAFAAMVQSFAWYHANQPGPYDVDASRDDQCFRPHRLRPTTMRRWLFESTFKTKISLSNKKIEETFFSSGRQERPCSDGAVDDAGKPLFTPGNGRASQWILKNQGEGKCQGDFSTWQKMVEYWDKGKVREASAPRPPSVSNGDIPGPRTGVRLTFKSGPERGQAWNYIVERKVVGQPASAWQRIANLRWAVATKPIYCDSFTPRTIPLCMESETGNPYQYRVRATAPAGSSRYTPVDNYRVIDPG